MEYLIVYKSATHSTGQAFGIYLRSSVTVRMSATFCTYAFIKSCQYFSKF